MDTTPTTRTRTWVDSFNSVCGSLTRRWGVFLQVDPDDNYAIEIAIGVGIAAHEIGAILAGAAIIFCGIDDDCRQAMMEMASRSPVWRKK